MDPTMIGIDTTTDETLAASVAQLDRDLRERLGSALRDARSADNARSILEQIRETLRRDEPDKTPVGAVFSTWESDGTYFLNAQDSEVVFTDGTTGRFDFGNLSETLDAEYGSGHGGEFIVGVDLRTNELNEDVHGPELSIHDLFSIPKPVDPPRSVLKIMSGNAETDAQATPAELDALAAHVREHGANDFLSVGIEVRFPTVYAAAIDQYAADQRAASATPPAASDQEPTP